MNDRKGETMGERKHEQASQAAFSQQSVGLRKLVLAPGWQRSRSGNPRGVGKTCLLKDRGLIGLLLLPARVENARPDIGQGSDRDGMAFAFGSFALIVLLGPGFLARTFPGKLLQGIAPGLDAAQPSMGFLIRPALEEDRRGASERLQARCTLLAAPVLPHFGHPPGTRPS